MIASLPQTEHLLCQWVLMISLPGGITDFIGQIKSAPIRHQPTAAGGTLQRLLGRAAEENVIGQLVVRTVHPSDVAGTGGKLRMFRKACGDAAGKGEQKIQGSLLVDGGPDGRRAGERFVFHPAAQSTHQ